MESLTTLLIYLMVILALLISASTTLKRMIWLYVAQALALTFVVLLTAFEPNMARNPLVFLAFLPAVLAFLVRPLLGRASLDEGRQGEGAAASGWWARAVAFLVALREAPRHAELTWLQHGDSRARLRGAVAAVIDLALIATAVLVATRLTGGGVQPDAWPSLAVAIALLLQGLFTMSNKRDIIAQIIGLLVMEHGLFLVAVRVAPPPLASLFVISLFCYLAITLTILLWILPELRRASNSIVIDDNSNLRG